MGPGFESLKVHQKGIIRTFYSSRVIGSDLLFYFRIYNKVKGLAVFRKPFLPLFKVYDIRRNLSDLTFLYSFYQNPPVFCGFFQIPSMRSVLMYSTGLFLIQFCIQLSFLSFCLPFFKLSLSFFRFKERLNGGQQCSCERVNLIIWYTRGVLFLSRHFFPITFSPFQRLFSCVQSNEIASTIVCTTSNAGVSHSRNLRTPLSKRIFSRNCSISFSVFRISS